jgi:hypothetical protein
MTFQKVPVVMRVSSGEGILEQAFGAFLDRSHAVPRDSVEFAKVPCHAGLTPETERL